MLINIFLSIKHPINNLFLKSGVDIFSGDYNTSTHWHNMYVTGLQQACTNRQIQSCLAHANHMLHAERQVQTLCTLINIHVRTAKFHLWSIQVHNNTTNIYTIQFWLTHLAHRHALLTAPEDTGVFLDGCIMYGTGVHSKRWNKTVQRSQGKLLENYSNETNIIKNR